MIKCNGCGETKPETEFYVRPRNKTGYETKCKQCLSKQGREYRRKNKDAKRAYYHSIKTERRNPADMTLMIKCNKCGEVKAATEFYARPLNNTGFDLKCKQCLREQGREYRLKNPTAKRSYYQRTRKARIEHMREYRKENMPAIMAKWHEYEQKYPERVQAGDAVHEAIKRKEILPARKCKCVDCGKKAMDLHHESYAQDQWLVVVPLCRSCHKLRHMSSRV